MSGAKEQESLGAECVLQPSKQLKLGSTVPELICIVPCKAKFVR